MESSKVPFIAEYDPSATIRPLKQYRPVSVRPWTLSAFLAATGVCFGLLLAVVVVEKEPTPIEKRDVSYLANRDNLYARQDDTATSTADLSAILSLASAVITPFVTVEEEPCTTIVEVTVVTCVAYTAAGYTCTYDASTIFPTTEPPGSCDTETSTVFSYDTGDLLSLEFPETTESPDSSSPETTDPVVEATPYTDPTVQATPTSEAAAPAATPATTEQSLIVTTTDTALLSLVPPNTVDSYSESGTTPAAPTTADLLSLAPQNTDEPISSEPETPTSDVVLPGSTSDLSATSYPTVTDTALLSLAQQSTEEPSSSVTELTYYTSQASAYLSLTSQTPTVLETIVETVVNTASNTIVNTETGVLSLTSQDTTIAQSFASSTLTPLARPSITSPASMTTSLETYLVIVSDGTSQTQLYTDIITDGSSLTAVGSIATTSTSSRSSSSSTSIGGKDPVLNENLVLIKIKWENWYYFPAVYLPKILAVIMATLWSIIFAGLKLMEPFYQLSANTGAYASASMFGNYLSSELNLLSLSATLQGQWVLLLGGVVLICWAAIVALSSESMMLISTATCSNAEIPSYRCGPGWAVRRNIVYVLMGLVGLVFVLVLVLILILGRRKRTGVFTNPASIATMAELLGNPLVQEDLQAIKPSSNDREVKMFLGENRYKLGLYDSSTGKESFFSSSPDSEQKWGLIKLDQIPSSRTLASRRQTDYGAVLNPGIMSVEESKANRKRRIFQSLFDTFMLLTALCIFALVLGYYLDHGDDPFNNFFNRGAFGPQFVLTSLGLILSIGLRRTSQEITVMAPYRTMARAFRIQSGVMAKRSILAPTPRTPWTAVYKGIPHRHLMVTIVALCAILADILLIAVSGVPFSSGQTTISLRVAVWTSLGILSIMILTLVAVVIYNRTSAGGTRKIPRSPDTLLGVWLYLCHSRLVTSNQSSGDDRESPLDEEGLKMKYDGYHCGFARVPSEDGAHRWTVDSAMVLRSAGLEKAQQRYQQSHQQRPEPYEASATPVESPYGHYPPRQYSTRGKPTPGAQQVHEQSQYYRNGVPFYEAQAKSPTAQAPAPRFEALRPQTHSLRAQNAPEPRESQARQQADPTLHEALAQWEYEQEYFNTRRLSAGSSEYSRWSNDGRSRYKYG